MQLPPIRSGRPELQSEGFCLGVTSSKKTGGVVIHSHVSDSPEVVAEIIHVLYELECIPGDFIHPGRSQPSSTSSPRQERGEIIGFVLWKLRGRRLSNRGVRGELVPECDLV